uniref:Uncharacterized protein n=1 Tax=Molossus molossus TaxID=27622 RepID=A0A7J8GR30_MOLMO|nr:hypothetical protein HJG59_011389 [Molossus molossus]
MSVSLPAFPFLYAAGTFDGHILHLPRRSGGALSTLTLSRFLWKLSSGAHSRHRLVNEEQRGKYTRRTKLCGQRQAGCQPRVTRTRLLPRETPPCGDSCWRSVSSHLLCSSLNDRGRCTVFVRMQIPQKQDKMLGKLMLLVVQCKCVL